MKGAFIRFGTCVCCFYASLSHVCAVLCLNGGVSGLYLHFVKHHCHQLLLIHHRSYTKNEVLPDVCQSLYEGILLLYTTKIYIQLI